MKKVLVIEDDQIVRNVYGNKLALDGFQVEVAPDGLAGWEMLEKFEPDVVLLDLIIPKISGTELLRKIRSDEKFKALPVVVLSNTYLTSVVQEAWKAGATKCLAKASCTPRQVTEVLRACVNKEAGSKSQPQDRQEATPATPAAAPPSPCEEAPATVQAAAHNEKSELEQQQELRGSFIASLPGMLHELLPVFRMASTASCEAERLKHLGEMQQRLGSIIFGSSILGLAAIANMAAATQALVQELQDRPQNLNASTLRTLASAVDFLGVMISRGDKACWGSVPSASVLVVDDEPISRRAVVRALGKVNLKAISVADPSIALALLEENSFDLVFLDVDMPQMNGFELCAALRKLPGRAKTPVVFVTGLSDFENRANSMISGGSDLIGKPFLAIELGVKALRYVLRPHVAAAQSRKRD